ncbi:hypothetical protein [Brevibacterium album]|uniref:hypothetical protein n=1 Tax=Brevibacterium album TaxID=417948 RepID=UPI000422671F|nr:hypothetical protein [Brevibacterium album]
MGAQGRREAAPEALPPRPRGIVVAAGIVWLESAALLVAAVAFIAVGAGSSTVSLIALAAMFVVLALGLFAVALAIWRMHRWGRPAAIAWQILQALFGVSMLTAPPVDFWGAAGAIVPAAIFLAAIFLPASLRAYELAAEYYAAHPSEPAPPPKRW